MNAEQCKEYMEQQGSDLISRQAVLDKLSAEIDRQEKWLFRAGYTMFNVNIAFDAIKHAIAESEDEE